MNNELAAFGAYNKLDQKNVTAWLDLRNKAAHAQYHEYTAEQEWLLPDYVDCQAGEKPGVSLVSRWSQRAWTTRRSP